MNINIPRNSNQSDHVLVSRVRQGDLEAYRELYLNYGKRVYQFAYKFLAEKYDAEDVLNEVFLKIWENRKTLKNDTSIQAYLFTIAYNNIRKRYLKKSRELKYLHEYAEEYLQEKGESDKDIDYNLFVERITKYTQLLPERRRLVFTLKYKEELSVAEIAEQMNVSSQFVKNQLVMARRFLSDSLVKDPEIKEILLFMLFSR